MTTMPTIFPTHTCFDDALEYLAARVARDPRLARGRRVLLVHGIALMPDGQPDAGEPFAHAWVEDAGVCLTMGFLDGVRVLVSHERIDFYRRLRIRQTTTYTVRQAWRENRRSATYGPWKPEYLALCRNKRTAGVAETSSAPEATTPSSVSPRPPSPGDAPSR